MATHVLAGDIGGTKTVLGLYVVDDSGSTVLVRERAFPSRDYTGLEQVVETFGADGSETVQAAAFGIAGPVLGDTVRTTNLPWVIHARELSRVLGGARVRLMNDLETTAYGALFLSAHEVEMLQKGEKRAGNVAVIAAGTGLGQAFLFWDGKRFRPSATEGGHADFGPRSDLEVDLYRFLARRHGRVSWERVVSGPGIQGIFEFLVRERGRKVAPAVKDELERAEDPSAVIGQAAVDSSCETCVEAIDLFVSAYGSQAGNLALSVFATGGVFVGGGVVTKLLPRVKAGGFMEAFRDKAPYEELMQTLPVRVILEPKTSLLGAARAAAELVT